jgi:hypothetical protein
MIVNRLNKTKVEREVDLAGEREQRDAQARQEKKTLASEQVQKSFCNSCCCPKVLFCNAYCSRNAKKKKSQRGGRWTTNYAVTLPL